MLGSATEKAERTGMSQSKQLIAIENALVNYVALNKRLPCPADGSLSAVDPNRGRELRNGSGICTSATPALANQKTGVLPWITLGIPEADAVSADLTMFDYRVYSGPKGLTQNNGADMSPCDTDNTPNADAAIGANGLCDSVSHDNTPTQFLQGKGLTVDKDGDVLNGMAYVLVYHGANARGAFLATGTRNALPANTNVKEFANTQGTDPATYTGTYYSWTPNLLADTSDDNYFDDRIVYMSIQDIVKKAGLIARNWPDDYLSPSRTDHMTDLSTDPLNPHFMSTGSGDTAFSATTSDGETILTYGSGGHTYAGCLWWPKPAVISNGTNRYRWSMYAEFAMADYTNDTAQGFTIGLIAASGGAPTTATCGDTSILGSRRLGWGGGTLAANYPNRVAIEVDARENAAANDPFGTHLAIDYSDTTHGSFAESCASGLYGTGCNASTSDSFLSDGLSTYHSIRIDISKRCSLQTTATGADSSTTIVVGDQTDIAAGMRVSGTGIATNATVTGVSGGTVTLSIANTGAVSGIVTFLSDNYAMLEAWVLSNNGCTANATSCDALKNIEIPFTTNLSATSEALHVKRCIQIPTPANDLDSFYFGITTSNRDTSETQGTNLAFRELRTALRLLK